MDAPSSPPFPLLTFQSSASSDSPAALRDFLLQTVADNQPSHPYRDKHPHLETWIPILTGLSDYVLSSFPSVNAGTWDILHEKAVLVNATIDVFHLFLRRFSNLFDTASNVALKTLVRLIILCHVLDCRQDGNVTVKEGIPSPKQLRDKCLSVATEVVRYLGDSLGSGGVENPTWESFRRFYAGCLCVGEAMVLGNPTLVFPLELSPLQQPHVREVASIPDKPNIQDVPSFFLRSPTEAVDLLCLFFDVLTQSMVPPVSSQPLYADLAHRLSKLMQSVFDSCLSNKDWPMVSETQATHLIRICSATKLLMGVQRTSIQRNVYAEMLSRLLLHRLSGQYTSVEDDMLRTLLVEHLEPQERFVSASNLAIVSSMAQVGSDDESGTSLAMLYVSRIIPLLGIGALSVAKTVLSSDTYRDIARIELDAIDRRLAELVSGNTDAGNADISMDLPSSVERLRTLMQSVFSDPEDSGEINTLFGQGTDYSGAVVCQFIRERVAQKSFVGCDAQRRVSVAKALSESVCPLAHGGDSECLGSASRDLLLLSTYKIAIRQLLRGDSSEVTATVRKWGNQALSYAVRHHSIDLGLEEVDDLVTELYRSLAHKERAVRLSAGQVLVEIISYYNRVGQVSWIRAEGIFDKFYELLRDARDPVKETVLITVGRVGRVTTANFLSVAISCLISRLADPNPALKGIAYMQLMSLAKFYGKTPYKLLDPYIGEIARYLITHWPHQPALLLETCRLVSQDPTEFISATLVHTLPLLFANCNSVVIDKISHILGFSPSGLFLEFSKDILTQVFLLAEKSQTDNALEFILEIMPMPSGGSVNAQTLIRSVFVELLGTFVFMLGSEDPKNVHQAMQALCKLEGILPSKGRKKTPSVGGVGKFLKSHIVGLISYLVDKLQGVQGRETMASKQQTLRGFGALVIHVGPEISIVAPQIMATLQVTLGVRELSDVTLDSWFVFLKTLDPRDTLAHAGPTSASLASFWKSLSPHGRDVASSILRYLVMDIGNSVDPNCLHDVVDLSCIEALSDVQHRLRTIRGGWSVEDKLHRLLERVSSDSLTVTLQALKEIKSLLDEQRDFLQSSTSGDSFNTLIGRTLRILSSVAGRDVDIEDIRLIAFECIGAIGAVDPDRLDLGMGDSRPIVLKDFTEEEESILFAMYLIKDVLVSAFRSTSDMGYQTNLAYAIQEMLKICQFDVSLMSSGRYTTSASLKARTRWDSLPKHVLETITPLLESRYTIKEKPLPAFELPIYPQHGTYREWLQQWTTCLISEAVAQKMFQPFRSVVRNKDVGVAHHLLPHLVLHALVSGDEDKMWNIRSEILAVLEDQVNEGTSSSADKKLLSAQVVFMLLDHLNKWARLTRKDLGDKKSEAKRSRGNRFGAAEQLSRIDSVLSSVDQDLMAKAAFQCKAYARSLMSFERHIVSLRQRNADSAEIQSCYERLHEIYCNLDEPDGMEGISTLILSPTLEHQIRQHESTGRWTSAQSCWELRLQQSPDNLEYHIGLLRCLRNLGHYDTLRTHVKGVLTRNPDWKQSLVGFEVESAWMIGDWNDVQVLVEGSGESTPPVVIASLLLAIREGDPEVIADALARARMTLGSPIVASGGREYRHTYEAVLNLHLVHEVELIHRFSSEQVQTRRSSAQDELTKTLNTRLNSTLPSFRTMEPILSMRRTAYGISRQRYGILAGEIGRSWLISAKIARKAGHWQTAYSAILQAQESRTAFSLMQKVRLIRATGEPLRALQELEHYLQTTRAQDSTPESDVVDITGGESELKQQKARAELLRARWMEESDRYDTSDVHKVFHQATELWQKWESGMFYYGKYQDRCFDTIPPLDPKIRGLRMRLSTVRCFTKAMKYGNKFIYQTVPRLLTIWLDMGEDATVNKHECFIKISAEISRVISGVPAFKWYTAFPQIASRVGHTHDPVFDVLSRLISTVIKEFPQQTLWLFASVVKSRNGSRESRGRSILERLKSSCANESMHVTGLINASIAMVNGLLALCDFTAPDPPRNAGPDAKITLSMKRDIPQLARLMPSPLIVPLQESLTVILPPTSAATNSLHQPFRPDIPTFNSLSDDIEVMKSLAKPRKITIHGSNGQTYAFLGKPKDDLRKDARLMDFNSIINKILNMNSDSRRRQLHIRTYGVVTLNEECGFIQWVPDTVAIRHVLLPSYEARGQKGWGSEMSAMFDRIKKATDNEAGKIFASEVLPMFSPVFHEWFLETFPEPSAWLASRLVYSRSAAVTSMIGFILGLGDRHCENILLDTNTGSVVHVDFNCLFDKGKLLEVPERVPFRLTQNILDGFGITGAEGVFRIACEITMGLLRENKDTLMTVLDPFIHDPLVEWEDEKRKLERQTHRRHVHNRHPIELRVLAKNALSSIEKKLRGIYRTSKDRVEKEVSTSNLVQMLIQEATDNANLGKMYPGWAPWH